MPAVKGTEIRLRRQRLGMKLGEFAEFAGVGYKTLANIECGQRQATSIEVVHRIAAALPDTTAEELLVTAEEAAEEDDVPAKGAAA